MQYIPKGWFKKQVFPDEVFDGAEFCSGKGVLSRCLKHGGYRFPGLDILDWDPYAEARGVTTSSNPLDMLSPSGMGSLAGNFD